MKKMQTLGIAVMTVALIAPAIAANAQSLATSDDGISASPKVRQRLEERRATFNVAPSTTTQASTTQPTGDGIAASPKIRAQLEERYAATRAVFNPTAFASSTTRSPNDGIAASPKLREQLNERALRSNIEMAPIVPVK
jgi:hypothetical protein